MPLPIHSRVLVEISLFVVTGIVSKYGGNLDNYTPKLSETIHENSNLAAITRAPVGVGAGETHSQSISYISSNAVVRLTCMAFSYIYLFIYLFIFLIHRLLSFACKCGENHLGRFQEKKSSE